MSAPTTYQPPKPTDEELLGGSLIWGADDGESWCIHGHHPEAVAIELVRRFETVTYADGLGEIPFEELSTSQVFGVYDEAFEILRFASAGTKGAEPYTVVRI